MLRNSLMDPQTVLIISVLFVAAFIASTFGFGVGLTTMPLLAIMVDMRTAASLSALVGMTVVCIVILKHWRKVQFRIAWYLIASSCVGVPIGLWLLHHTKESYMKICLSLVVIGFSCYSLLTKQKTTLRTDRTAGVFGVIAGVLGGAYTIPGPPVIIYGILRRWPPEIFRATLLWFFFPTMTIVIIGYYYYGYLTSRVMSLYMYSFPAVLIAIVMGNYVNRSIPKDKFIWFVHALLILLGLLLSIQVIQTTIFTPN